MSAAPELPYAGLNLRRNPFGVLPAPELGALAVVEVEREGDAVLAALAARDGPPLLLQLVGPPGSGKSTHLRALSARLPRTPVMAWSERLGWPPVPPGRAILVDDAHLLPRRLRRLIFGRDVVVAATHEELSSPVVRRRGFAVRTVDVAALATVERLRRIVDRRIEGARRGPGPVPEVPNEVLRDLLDRHGPDFRSILDVLYDRIQEMA